MPFRAQIPAPSQISAFHLFFKAYFFKKEKKKEQPVTHLAIPPVSWLQEVRSVIVCSALKKTGYISALEGSERMNARTDKENKNRSRHLKGTTCSLSACLGGTVGFKKKKNHHQINGSLLSVGLGTADLTGRGSQACIGESQKTSQAEPEIRFRRTSESQGESVCGLLTTQNRPWISLSTVFGIQRQNPKWITNSAEHPLLGTK